MRSLTLIFVAAILSAGCDTRKDTFIEKIEAPTVKINSTTKPEYVIMLNDSLKKSQGYFVMNYFEHADTKSFDMEYLKQNGSDSLVSNTIYFKPALSSLNHNVTYDVKITDAFGRTGQANLNLYYFDNLMPVGNLRITKTALHDPREYEIDASGSYDKDKNFGGAVSSYTFSVNSFQYPVLYNKMNFIFPAAGSYSIALMVEDNEGLYSIPVNSVVTIP